MKTVLLTITISEQIGSVSAEIYQPKGMGVMFVLAHGAGAGMHHSFMTSLASELASHNIGTCRFNFPFIERGKRMPDVHAVAEKTIDVVIDHIKNLYPATPLIAGGKSFGGRMTSQLMSKKNISAIKALIFIGFPLHPAGKPSIDRANHLKLVDIPMLFLQGTKDALADLSLIQQTSDSLDKASIEIFAGADHSFKSGKKVVIPELAKVISDYIIGLIER